MNIKRIEIEKILNLLKKTETNLNDFSTLNFISAVLEINLKEAIKLIDELILNDDVRKEMEKKYGRKTSKLKKERDQLKDDIKYQKELHDDITDMLINDNGED